MKRLIKFTVLLASVLFGHSSYSASPGCEDSKILTDRMITAVCWDCMFPIKISGVTLSSAGSAPSRASTENVCLCQVNGQPKAGVVTSMWEPSYLVEFPVMPGCMSVLNGEHVEAFGRLNQGHHGDATQDATDRSFTHYHFYAFPLLQMVDLFVKRACNTAGYVDLDLLYFSELDPTWNNDILAFFTAPEAAAVANPIAVLACTAEAATSAFGRTIDSLWWCAGTWGQIYPLAGITTDGLGAINSTSLLKTRVISSLHRRGVMRRSMGSDTVCRAKIDPTIPKSQYKFTMMHPVPETRSAHVIGEPTLIWGAGRSIPAVGEDPVYLIWNWNDCCNTK